MKALVVRGPGDVALDDLATPVAPRSSVDVVLAVSGG